jgi:amino acid transporter
MLGEQMTDQPSTAEGTGLAPAARLEPNAIGVAQDTVIGMASSAPAATIGLSLAALAAATAYGSGPILLLTAIPMLVIANAYRRCNMWNANCGASFEWVGRAIDPYLGFLTGWLMVVAYIIGTVAEILLLGPSVLAVFGSTSTDTWAWIAIGSAVGVVMLIIAVVGIKITARVQVSMALVEYLILVGMAIWGLVAVLSHHPGTFPITKGWFSLSGIDGKGDAVAGFLIAVFVYGGWDGTLYVNEEVKHRRTNPGRAAIIAVALLAVIYTLAQVGFQGVVSPAKLQANSASALVYVAQALGGGFWAKMMATSVQNAFNDVIAVTGQLFAIFYIMTALAMMVYYRRRVFGSARDALILGLLPLGAAGFLGWMLVRTLQNSPSTQRWSLIAIVALGLVMLLIARFVLRSPFFSIRRESDTQAG